ncbi:hypothetical protein AMST5_00835 [freshwater sediment metagenome]|uniref:Uncharacterized protein n=1 Tax=freshwater sediment metagenome TaxID=556182 RepID=A0AA48RC59_9ZZZZ
MDWLRQLCSINDGAEASNLTRGSETLMAIHKEILEWQAAHPNTAWLAWGITWLVILSILFLAAMLIGVWRLCARIVHPNVSPEKRLLPY